MEEKLIAGGVGVNKMRNIIRAAARDSGHPPRATIQCPRRCRSCCIAQQDIPRIVKKMEEEERGGGGVTFFPLRFSLLKIQQGEVSKNLSLQR